MFLYFCYSGLSYIDLKELTNDQIVKGMNGKDWIYTKREKAQIYARGLENKVCSDIFNLDQKLKDRQNNKSNVC